MLPELIGHTPELLKLNVELFTEDPGRRLALENAAQGMGYMRSRPQRSYRCTARIDLESDVHDIAMTFMSSCRRFIRNPKKKGYGLETIEDDRWIPRMERLWEETFERTDTRPPRRTWRQHVRFAREHPDLYRIIGTFGPDYPESDSLLAFACGRNNGDHAVYSDGVSTRDVESGIALTYAPMWRLIKWAKEQNCNWFDLGGISHDTYEDGEDPRGGIADFKRRFSEDVIEVGTEWEFRPKKIRTELAEKMSASASKAREILGKIGR